MALYGYRGVHESGRNVKGVREAESPRDLKAILKRESIFVTSLWEMGRPGTGAARKVGSGGTATTQAATGGSAVRKGSFLATSLNLNLKGRVSKQDVTTITRQLATLIKAGIPLVEALAAVTEQADKEQLKVMLTGIRTSVNEGESFASALSRYPRSFSDVYINMVNAGEQSGTLELVLERLAEFMESQARIRAKIISAIAYPALMTVIGAFILAVLMGVVVPKVRTIFDDFGQALPWFTMILIFVSGVISNYFWLLLPALLGGVIGFIVWKRSAKGKAVWHAALLRAPVFGELVLMLAMARFARTLGTLLAGGVQMLRALQITKHVLGNVQLEKVVEGAIVAVREGAPLHDSIQRSGLFPPLVTRMIAIGEKSGQLEGMLSNVSSFYESRSEAKISILTSLLEPVLILIMGAGAGYVAFAILWPIFKITQFAG